MEQYTTSTIYAATTFSYNMPGGSLSFWTEANQTGAGGLNVKVRKFYNGLGQLIQTQSVGVTPNTILHGHPSGPLLQCCQTEIDGL